MCLCLDQVVNSDGATTTVQNTLGSTSKEVDGNQGFSENLLGSSGDSEYFQSNGVVNGHSTPNGVAGGVLKAVDEEEESGRLIDQILDLQKTLDGWFFFTVEACSSSSSSSLYSCYLGL